MLAPLRIRLQIICKKSISVMTIKLADALLLQFCRKCERMYGNNIITPNMHFHTHLSDCILDYGPLHAFWLFPFKRYNGLLGQQLNNNRSIEVQLMNHFVKDNTCIDLFSEYREEFSSLFLHDQQQYGSFSDSTDVVSHIPSLMLKAPKIGHRSLDICMI